MNFYLTKTNDRKLSSTLNSIYVGNDNQVFALGNNGILVSAERPFETSYHDPYASPSNCEPAKGVATQQVADKAALLNAVSFKGQTIAVTANGIKTLTLE